MYSSNRAFINAVNIAALFSICQFAVAADAHQQMIVQSGNPFLNKISSGWQNYIATPALAKWQELPTAYKWGLGITGGVAALAAAWKTHNSIRDYIDPVGAAERANSTKDTGKMLKAIDRVEINHIDPIINACWNQDLLHRVFYVHKDRLCNYQLLHIRFPQNKQLPRDLRQYTTNVDLHDRLKAKDLDATAQLRWILVHKSKDSAFSEFLKHLLGEANPFEKPSKDGEKNAFALMCQKFPDQTTLNHIFNQCFPWGKYIDYNRGTSNATQRKTDQTNALKDQFPIFLNLADDISAHTAYYNLCNTYFEDNDWQELIKAYHQSYENHPLFGLLQDNKPGLFPQNQGSSSSLDQTNVDPTGASTSGATQQPVVDLNQLHAMQESVKTAIDTNSIVYFEASTDNIDWTTYLAFLGRTKYEHHDQKLSPITYSFVKALNEEQEPVVGKLLIDKALKYNFLATSQQEKVLRYLAREAIESRCITYLQFIIENELYPSSDLPELEMLTANYAEGKAYIQDRIKSIPHEKIFLSF